MRAITYKTIGLLFIGGFVLLLASCENKTTDDSTPQKIVKADSVTVPPKEFVDLLFAQETIKEVNQLAKPKSNDPSSVWGKFLSVEKLINENKKEEAKIILKEIAFDKNSEARAIAWAWNELRELGETPATPIVLGLILEVPQEGTTEYLAMYSDRTARYINYTGKICVWETHEKTMDSLLNSITTKTQNYFDKQKLSKGRNKLPTENVRFSFLTTAGIFQIEKAFDDVSEEKSEIGDIFFSATNVLTVIVNQAVK